MTDSQFGSGRLLVVAFEGWNDAGEAASGAVRTLKELLDLVPIARIRELWPQLPGVLAPMRGELADRWLYVEVAVNAGPNANPQKIRERAQPDFVLDVVPNTRLRRHPRFLDSHQWVRHGRNRC